MGNRIHRTDERLELYVLHRMENAEQTELEEHLLVCDACRERCETVEAFVKGMEAALRERRRPRRFILNEWRRWFFMPELSGAVVVATIVIAALIVWGGQAKFTPIAAIELTAIRGEMPSVQPTREVDLTLGEAPREGRPFRIEIVNSGGDRLWMGPAEIMGSALRAHAPGRFREGDYFVRVYSRQTDLLREYGFRVRGAQP